MSQPSIVFLNDRLLPQRKACISVFDHGFLYGDGLYETVRATPQEVFFWKEHWLRLQAGAHAIRFSFPWTQDYIEKALRSVVRANQSKEASLRITLTRGEGPLGLDPRVCKRPTLVIQMHPLRPIEEWRRVGVSIGIVKTRRVPPECLHPSIKSLSALSLIQAKQEALRMKVFEGILLNAKGYLTEGTTTNLFFFRKSRLCTPSLECGVLPGITRAQVLRQARRQKISVKEGRFTPRDLAQADEIFLTNVSLGVMPVTTSDLCQLAIGPITQQLMAYVR